MKSTPTARWAGSHPTNTRANGHNTTNNNQQPSKHPVHKTRPDQGNPSCRMKTYWGIQLLMPLPYQNV